MVRIRVGVVVLVEVGVRVEVEDGRERPGWAGSQRNGAGGRWCGTNDGGGSGGSNDVGWAEIGSRMSKIIDQHTQKHQDSQDEKNQNWNEIR